MEKVSVFLVPKSVAFDIDFNPSEGVDPCDTSALCSDDNFIQAVEEKIKTKSYVLIPVMDQEGTITDAGVVCVCADKFEPGISIGEEYDSALKKKGKPKKQATIDLKTRTRNMNDIVQNHAIIYGLLTLASFLDKADNDPNIPKYKKRKGKILLDSVGTLYGGIKGKNLLCDCNNSCLEGTFLPQDANTREDFIRVETEFNKFMKEFSESCSTFVSLFQKITDVSGFTFKIGELLSDLEEMKEEVAIYEKQAKEYITRDTEQRTEISELKETVKRLQEESSRGKGRGRAEEPTDREEELERKLQEKEKRIRELESTIEQLEEGGSSRRGDESKWQRKYNELAVMYESMKRNYEQMESMRERMKQQEREQEQQQRTERAEERGRDQSWRDERTEEREREREDPYARKNPFSSMGSRPKM